MMFVSDNVISDIVTNMTLINDIFESLCVKLIIKNKVHYVDLIYRIPSSSLDLFVDEIDRINLQNIPLMDVIICGNININMLGPTTDAGINFSVSMSEKNLKLCTTQPTRVASTIRVTARGTSTNMSKTLIDHIWSSHISNIQPYVIETAIADHFPVLTFVEIPKENSRILTHKRDFNRVIMAKFLEQFRCYSIEFDPSNDPCNDIVRLNTDLINMIQKFFPIESKFTKLKNLQSPWIDQKLLKLIDKKFAIFKNYKNNHTSFDNFKQYRNLLNKALTLAKKIYFEEKFLEIQGQKETWQLINGVMSIKNKSTTYCLEIDNQLTLDGNNNPLAHHFDHFFMNP